MGEKTDGESREKPDSHEHRSTFHRTSSACSHFHFNPTRANFHEPSLCRFSRRMPLSMTLTGLSFTDVRYVAAKSPTSIAQPSAIWTSLISGVYFNTLKSG